MLAANGLLALGFSDESRTLSESRRRRLQMLIFTGCCCFVWGRGVFIRARGAARSRERRVAGLAEERGTLI